MQAPLIHRVSEKLCLGMYIVTYVLWGAGFWYFCIIWNYAYSPYYFFLPKARLLLDSSLPQPAPHPQSIALSGYSFGMPTALPAFIKPIFACVNFLYVCYRIFCFFFFYWCFFRSASHLARHFAHVLPYAVIVFFPFLFAFLPLTFLLRFFAIALHQYLHLNFVSNAWLFLLQLVIGVDSNWLVLKLFVALLMLYQYLLSFC